jgi:hypothetical protein
LSSTDSTNGGSEPINEDKIGNWVDLTGAATDATESNTANQPTYETNVQNGLPAVKFDETQSNLWENGVNKYTNMNNYAGLSKYSFYWKWCLRFRR